MDEFSGFIGAKVLTPNTWNVVNSISPATDSIFTFSLRMCFSPGFSVRDLNEMPNTDFTKNKETGIYEITGGIDGDALVHVALTPGNVNTNNLSAIQPYLIAPRYVLAAGVVRVETGFLMPAGWKIIAYTPNPDVSINVFGVEGRATRFKATI